MSIPRTHVLPLRLAYLSLVRRRAAALIALAGIAMPVAAGGILLRLVKLTEARFATLDRSFDAVVGGKGDGIDLLLGALGGEGERYPAPFTESLYQTLTDRYVARPDHRSAYPPFLQSVIPITVFARVGTARVLGTTAAYWQRPAPEASPTLVSGRQPAAVGEVVVSQTFAAAHELQLGSVLTGDPWVSPRAERNAALPRVQLTVVGITKPTGVFWDGVILADVGGAQSVLRGLAGTGELHPVWQEHVVHYLLIHCAPGGYAPLSDLINTATIAQAVDVPTALSRLEELTGGGKTLGTWTCALILLLGGLAVVAVLLTRFDGMTQQLAILRALGYGAGEIALALLAEGLMVGLAAAGLGALVDAAAFPWVRRLGGAFLPADVPSSLWQSLPVWVAAALAGIAAVALPVLRSSRRDPHRLLRSS